jgi:hypothetical protein
MFGEEYEFILSAHIVVFKYRLLAMSLQISYFWSKYSEDWHL